MTYPGVFNNQWHFGPLSERVRCQHVFNTVHIDLQKQRPSNGIREMMRIDSRRSLARFLAGTVRVAQTQPHSEGSSGLGDIHPRSFDTSPTA